MFLFKPQKPKPTQLPSPELSPEPRIDPAARVQDSTLGQWTEVGPGWSILESSLGDYSYAAGTDGVIHYTTVGKFCSFASHVVINPGDHPTDRVSQHHFTYRRSKYKIGPDDPTLFAWRRNRPCNIGHDVWIGNGAKVMAGVTIGTGAVIGAGAVVTKDVAPYQVVAGVPAALIRNRFPDYVVKKLLDSGWWDWPHDLLRERMNDIMQIDRFLEQYC